MKWFHQNNLDNSQNIKYRDVKADATAPNVLSNI